MTKRVKIELPAGKPIGTATLPVRIGDINYGGHLGNDKLLLYAQEARMQVLQTLDFTELECGGHSLIMADAEIAFKAEAFWGDILEITLFAGGATGSGFSLFYLFEKTAAGKKKPIAQARTGMVAFDYALRKVVPLAPVLKAALNL